MTTQLIAALALFASLGCNEAPEAPPQAQSVTTNAPAERRGSDTADEAYERGRQLMENHCGDCYQRSAAGVLEAVKELQRAVALGRNDADVHRLLRDAYNGLVFIDFSDDPTRRRPYEERLHEEIRIVAKLDPADLENRMRYVELLESSGQKLAELQAIVAMSPKHAPAHFRLAQLLLETGDAAGAVAHARGWLENANAEELSSYSDRLFEGIDETRLRRMLALDPDLHPASFELAKQTIWERHDFTRGVEIARTSLDDAPPIVADKYLPVLTNLLDDLSRPDDAASLRREFEVKAKTGEAQKRQLH